MKKRPIEQLGFVYRDGAYYREGDDTPYELRPITNMSFGEMFVPIDTPSSVIVVQIIGQPSSIEPVSRSSAASADSRAYTAQTIRLDRHCRECSDTLPEGAQFCIKCGAPCA